MADTLTKDDLRRKELDEAYRALSDAGVRARKMRARLDAVTAALYACLRADLPDEVRQEALDALEDTDG